MEGRPGRQRQKPAKFVPSGRTDTRADREAKRTERRRRISSKAKAAGMTYQAYQQQMTTRDTPRVRRNAGGRLPRVRLATKAARFLRLPAPAEREGSPVPGSRAYKAMVKRERDAERKRLQRERDRGTKRAAVPQSAQEAGTGSWDWRGDGVSGEPVREDDAQREMAGKGGGGDEAEASQWRVEAQRTTRLVGLVEGLLGAAGGGRAVLSREEKQRLRREEIEEKVDRRLARQRLADEEEQLRQQRDAAEEEEERQEREASREDEEARAFEESMEQCAEARRSMKAWVLGALERARHNNLELGGFTEELLLWFLSRWWAEVGEEIRAQGDGPTAARRFFTHLRGQRLSTTFMDGLDRGLHECGEQRRLAQGGAGRDSDGEM